METEGKDNSVGRASETKDMKQGNIRQKTDREQWGEMAQLVQHQTEDRQGTVGRDGSVGTASDIRWINRMEG